MSSTPPQLYPHCRVSVRQARMDSAAKVVSGEVYVPFTAKAGETYPIEVINDLVDTWATYIEPSDLQKLARDYMRWSQAVDVMHDRDTKGGDVVESFLAPEGGPYVAGAWVAVVHPHAGIWPAVESEQLTGFSIDVYAGYEFLQIKVAGKGKVFDLTGVDEWPFAPNEVEVDGEREIRIARMVSITPWGFSLVDRAANRREWQIDEAARASAARGVQPILRRAPDAAPSAPSAPAAAPTVDAVERAEVPPVEPVAVEATPAAAPVVDPSAVEAAVPELPAPTAPAPIADDEKPATRGWLRQLLDSAFASFRRDPAALQPDGTPPPALALPPVPATPTRRSLVVAPAARRQEAPMSATLSPIAIRRAAADKAGADRVLRLMPGSGTEPLDFDKVWAVEDVSEDVCEAKWAMDDVFWSITANRDSYASVDAMLGALAAQMNKFLDAIEEIYTSAAAADATDEEKGAVKISRLTIAQRQLAISGALVEVTERAGKKYSKDTKDKLGKIATAIKAAHEEASRFMEEVELDSNPGPGDAIATTDTETGEQVADAGSDKKTAAARAAARAARRVTRTTPDVVVPVVEPAAPAVPAELTAALTRMADLEGKVAASEKAAAEAKTAAEAATQRAADAETRLKAVESRRDASGQVGGDGAPAGTGESAPRATWLDQGLTRAGAGHLTKPRG